MSEIAAQPTPKKMSIVRVLLSVLLWVGVFFAAFYGLAFLFLMLVLGSYDSATVIGPAPNDVFAVRREWGQEKLPYFDETEKWIRGSKQIADDIGKVTGVAPIGSPNNYGESFGEASSDMNLQVVGERGEGTLLLQGLEYRGSKTDKWRLRGLDLKCWRFKSDESEQSE